MHASDMAQNARDGVSGSDVEPYPVVERLMGDSIVKRFVVILLIALVGVPWTAFLAPKGDACSMPRTIAASAMACSYCAPAASVASAIPTLEAGCCRFPPTPESVSAQAGSIGVAPKPLQSPDLAAATIAIDGVSIPAAPAARDSEACRASPPHAPSTRTTHLLL